MYCIHLGGLAVSPGGAQLKKSGTNNYVNIFIYLWYYYQNYYQIQLLLLWILLITIAATTTTTTAILCTPSFWTPPKKGESSSTQPSNPSWDLWKTCCLWPSLVIASVQKAPVARFSGWWKAFVEQKVQPCGKKRIATEIILESYHTFQTCKQFNQKGWLFYSETFDSQKSSEIKQRYRRAKNNAQIGLLYVCGWICCMSKKLENSILLDPAGLCPLRT